MLYNNLYKASWVVVHDEEKRIIDNNALLEEKIGSTLRAASFQEESKEQDEPSGEGEFVGGLNAENIDALFDSEGSANVLKSVSKAERDAILAEVEQAKAELADLRAQADRMIDDAKAEIASIQLKAYEEAKIQGQQEGERIGKQEAQAVKDEYLSRKKQLEADYEKKIAELEPEFIEILTGIYEHIFKVDLSSYHDLVTGLLTNTLQKVEGNGSLLVHVSRADYEEVLKNKERIRSEATGGGVSLEIVEDMTLSPSQCYIETENGIYDCSLDVQLSELGRKLKLLSYTRD